MEQDTKQITFGQALRAYRESSGLTQIRAQELYKTVTGKKILLTPYEDGSRSPTIDVVDNICSALHADFGTKAGNYYFVDRSNFIDSRNGVNKNFVLADVSDSAVCVLGDMLCKCKSRTYENFLKEGCEHYR